MASKNSTHWSVTLDTAQQIIFLASEHAAFSFANLATLIKYLGA
jgi:hypothetical protein